MYKKSAIDLTDLALGITILGITVSIGAVILMNFRDNQLTEIDTGTVVNETTNINGTADALSTTWYNSVTNCYNSSNEIIAPANYTIAVDPANGIATITNATAVNWNSVTCTYDIYNTSDPRFSLADDAAAGLAEYGNWFDIIVIVGIAALILSIIFLAFGREKGVGGGVNY